MDAADSFPPANTALLDDEEKSWGQMTIRRMRTRRLPVRTRVLLFAAVAVGVVLVPFAFLYAFEGIESGSGGLIVEQTGSSTTTTAVRPITDLLDATPSAASGTSISVAIPSATTSSSPYLRQDLPERELTPYVNPLIGTEGLGHCIPPGSFHSDGKHLRVQQSPLVWRSLLQIVPHPGKIKLASSTTIP